MIFIIWATAILFFIGGAGCIILAISRLISCINQLLFGPRCWLNTAPTDFLCFISTSTIALVLFYGAIALVSGKISTC